MIDAADSRQNPGDLIRINDRDPTSRIIASTQEEVMMPFDAMLVSAAAAAMFLLLAGALAWGDYQTQPERLKGPSQKR